MMAGGKTEILFSGQATTNSYVYERFNALGFGSIAIVVDGNATVQSGQTVSTSGISYTIRGYPALTTAPGYYKTIKGDTVIGSGDCHYNVLTDPYEQIDVGVKSTQSNLSGLVTVTVTGKRRT